ncbi:MAG: CpsD/CapB family tyrosine-protein kinase [Clostridia bacterium]|nr:CpsD/CapB family tyrosine-protein kinase [Clostridia bacterium]
MNRKPSEPTKTNNNTLLNGKLSFAATEAYKLLRANLKFTLRGESKCNIVGITSSVRGEGKSTTAFNLSYTLAETGKRVLLIDADLRLPSIAKKMGIRGTPGLTNILARTSEVKDAMRTSREFENWTILPSGDIPPNPTEMLGSAQMTSFLRKLAEVYDFIIVDFPPINIVSDALVLAPLLDGMIVVVRENYSERRELNSCIDQLRLSNVHVLGFVMNGAGDESSAYGKYKRRGNYYSKYKYYKKSGYESASEESGD